MPVRYAFAQNTAKLLEKWSWMHSHPNGGVALTSQIKSDGWFWWMIPGQRGIPEDSSVDVDSMRDGASMYLEGVMITNFKPTDADMTSNNNLVEYTMTLSIDRYYPKKLDDLKIVGIS